MQIEDRLTDRNQRVGINCSFSDWVAVTIGVLQVMVLGLCCSLSLSIHWLRGPSVICPTLLVIIHNGRKIEKQNILEMNRE